MTAQTSTRTHNDDHRAAGPSAAVAHLPGGCRAVHTVGALAEATHGGRHAAMLRDRREGTAAKGIRRGSANRARGPVPQLVVAPRPRVGDGPGRQISLNMAGSASLRGRGSSLPMLAYGIRVYRSVWRPIVRWAVSRRVVGHY